MRDPHWVALSDAQRGQLIQLWLIASDRNGEIPSDPAVLKKLCYLDSDPDLQFFIDQGFIEYDANMTPIGCQHDAKVTQQSRVEESRGEESRKTKGRFTPPSLQEVSEYCLSRKNAVLPTEFIDHYEANGWMRGKTKIKCWKACVRTWEKQNNRSSTQKQTSASRFLENLKNA